MANYIFLYGLAGARDSYRVVRYSKISNYRNFPIRIIKEEARKMVEEYPLIIEVYAIDNCYEVYQAFRDTAMKFSIDENIAFRSLLENEAIRVI